MNGACCRAQVLPAQDTSRVDCRGPGRGAQYLLTLPPLRQNFCSRAALEALGSCLNNKYSEGYPGKR